MSQSQEEIFAVAVPTSRFGNSVADKMWRNRRSASSMENPDSLQLDSVSAGRPEIYDRVDHVLNGLHSLLPSGMTGSSPVGILTELMRGMRRDISLIPEEDVQTFMRSIGEACIWIADGSMDDLNEEEEDAGIRGNSAEKS